MMNQDTRQVIILHNPLSPNPTDDERDVLDQAHLVKEALKELGYHSQRMEFNLNIPWLINGIRKIDPAFIFNLVETVDGRGKLSFMAPAILESRDIRFSGSGSTAMFLTTDKVTTKKILRSEHIATPDWATTSEAIEPEKEYILKPISEDGSVGITDELIYMGNRIEHIPEDWFAEEFIQGREFNVSVLAGARGSEVLPPAEMRFRNYTEDRPRILGYKAKWDTDSFEYKNTVRSFAFEAKDASLLTELKRISAQCWSAFGLKGYARVDFRISNEGIPYVIEINANPCISPDSGFIAACEQAGLGNTEVIKRIIDDIDRK